MSLSKYSIGAKIFGAFIAMSLIIAILGAAAYGVLTSAGNMAVTTFDGPLMAINYARAAQSDFISLQKAELKFETAPASEREAIFTDINDLYETFSDDLGVAEQRSFAGDELGLIRQIRGLVAQWRSARSSGDAVQRQKLDAQISGKFDLLVELN